MRSRPNPLSDTDQLEPIASLSVSLIIGRGPGTTASIEQGPGQTLSDAGVNDSIHKPLWAPRSAAARVDHAPRNRRRRFGHDERERGHDRGQL